MKINTFKILGFLGLILLFGAGCATTKPRPVDQTPMVTLANQVTQLQNELQTKNQEIQQLEGDLESRERPRKPANNFSKKSSTLMIHVAGVSVKDLQQALVRAGFDPGPVDGKAGKKTKTAIKEFQRRNKIKVTGIVGEKTWGMLNK